jgi:formiminotetrahydrofolate cyclodeaminase
MSGEDAAPSAELPLGQLLAALSERSPAPGAGTAAAWAGALAAALLEMVAAYADNDRVSARAATLRARLLDAGDADAGSYQPVLEAMRLPPSDASRRQQVDAALSAASEAPLTIARAAAEVTELAVDIVRRSKPALRGDAIVAVLLGEAATRSVTQLVEINLGDRGDDPRLSEAARLADRAALARGQLSDT